MAETRRNHWGHYLVVPPEGGQPVGYRRVTTVAKVLDDGGGLMPWKATATVVGALRRPGLLGRWQALMAEHPDPWYGSADSKKACKKLVEECSAAGGSTDRADLGTALHAVIEHGTKTNWSGPTQLLPAMQGDIDAYRSTMAAAGVVIDPALVEAVVVLDDRKIAGTSDNLRVTLPGHGDVVADLKTGTDLQYSWQAIAIQLAVYANADAVYVQGENPDGSEDRRLAMPALSRTHGLVIHLPAGEGRCELHMVDLVDGWEMFQRSLEVEAWRKRKNLASTYTFDRPAQHTQEIPPISAAPGGPPPVEDDFDAPKIVGGAVETLDQMWELEHAAAEQEFSSPVEDDFDAPKPVGAAPAAGPSIEEREAARRAEIAQQIADSPVTKMVEAARQLVEAVPTPQLPKHPDEGADLSGAEHEDAWVRLRERLEALEIEQKSWIVGLIRQALAHGVDFHARTRTLRRFELYRGLVALCTGGQDEDAAVRALAALALEDEAPRSPDIDPGHAVGALDAARAARFAQLVDAFLANELVPVMGDDGAVRLVAA